LKERSRESHGFRTGDGDLGTGEMNETTKNATTGWSSRARIPALILSILLAVPPLAGAQKELYPGVRVPKGYHLTLERTVGSGVTRYTLVKRRGARQVVRVARIVKGAPYALRSTISQGHVAGSGPLFERTSSMCRRYHCLVGVNGDFFYHDGLPAGSVMTGGEPVIYPRKQSRPHLVIARDGSLRLGGLELSSKLTLRYPKLRERPREGPTAPVDEAIGKTPLAGPLDAGPAFEEYDEVRSIAISKLNVPRKGERVVMYTQRFGSRTETSHKGVELVLEPVESSNRIRVGRSLTMRFAALREHAGNSAIPKNGAVLSAKGDGAKTLAALWDDVRSGAARRDVVLRIDADPSAWDVLAGNPTLLRDGKAVDPGNSGFARARHPRTLVGWTREGDVLLVTVDGRRPGRASGMSLREAASLMKRLGAINALNLDGGGSTTFVVKGTVKNRPSDRLVRRGGRTVKVTASRRGERVLRYVERQVAVALLVVHR
jgi:hypothetical protein